MTCLADVIMDVALLVSRSREPKPKVTDSASQNDQTLLNRDEEDLELEMEIDSQFGMPLSEIGKFYIGNEEKYITLKFKTYKSFSFYIKNLCLMFLQKSSL